MTWRVLITLSARNYFKPKSPSRADEKQSLYSTNPNVRFNNQQIEDWQSVNYYRKLQLNQYLDVLILVVYQLFEAVLDNIFETYFGSDHLLRFHGAWVDS